jgi:predicted RNase H-like nuclease (RuvC/YqgF family)
MPLTSLSSQVHIAQPAEPLNEQLNQLRGVIDNQRHIIEERDREIVQLRSSISDKDKRIKELEEKIQNMTIKDPTIELDLLKLKRIKKILLE